MTSDTSEFQVVLHRIERLETENRRLRRACLLLSLVVGALVLTGESGPKRHTFEASAFSLTDSNGKERAKLTMLDDAPALVFYDATGKPEAALGANPFPDLVRDQRGRLLPLLRESGASSRLGLRFFGGLGRKTATYDGEGLSLARWNGPGVASLTLGDEGPELNLLGADDSRAILGSTKILVKSAGFFQKEAYSIYTAEGLLALQGLKKAEGTIEKRPAASLLLFDRDSKVVWRAP